MTRTLTHRSRGRLRCDHCGDRYDTISWVVDNMLVCNDCETDLCRTYCPICENYVETDAPQCDTAREQCPVLNGTVDEMEEPDFNWP
jgi:hypothetical protein